MITECYSYTGNCPCLRCKKRCCIEDPIDTEKLCDKAREYCEACASKHAEREKRRAKEWND